jgi:hypothetical protein
MVSKHGQWLDVLRGIFVIKRNLGHERGEGARSWAQILENDPHNTVVHCSGPSYVSPLLWPTLARTVAPPMGQVHLPLDAQILTVSELPRAAASCHQLRSIVPSVA